MTANPPHVVDKDGPGTHQTTYNEGRRREDSHYDHGHGNDKILIHRHGERE